ncbi:hypothetical protein RQP46_001901 [Phenoliferia psychrophenolica]
MRRDKREASDRPASPSSPLEIASLSPPPNGNGNGNGPPSGPPPPRPDSSSAQSASSTITPRTPPPTSSKSVLTIALQRAQSAVLLDSANNVPAAIAAYTQSVRLLKDVMVRVEEGSRRERERERETREDETEEQVERRKARTERRERMKVDEARRLKVIHDTYEDRIKMLLAMSPDGMGGASQSQPNSPATPTTTFQTSSDPPFDPRTTPLPYAPAHAAPSPTMAQYPTTALALPTSNDDWSEGIGSAMLLGSPPPSPLDPMIPGHHPPSEPPPPLPRDSLAAPAPMASMMRRRPSIADEVIVESEEDGDYLVGEDNEGDTTATATPNQQQQQQQRHSSSSGTDDDGAVPVTAMDFGGQGDIHWPSSTSENNNRSLGSLAQSSTSPILPSSSSGPSADPAIDQFGDNFASLKLDPLPPLPRSTSGHRAYSSTGSALLLVAETTDLGTISQRRRSPQMQRSGDGPEVWGTPTTGMTTESEEDDDADHWQDQQQRVVVRQPSSDMDRFEFGQPYPAQPNSAGPSTTTGAGGGYSSHSLPTRLRTASQPGKRPNFTSFDSAPALPSGPPPLSVNTQRGAPGYPRKASIPTPTSLYAPQYPALNRTSSHSSQGSITEDPLLLPFLGSSNANNRGPSPNPSRASSALSGDIPRAETPTSGSFSRFSHASALSSISSAPTSTAASQFLLLAPPPPDQPTLTPVPPLRRPFHLMRQILLSIETGAYVTPRLYVPKQMWSQTGVKLVAVETKSTLAKKLGYGTSGKKTGGTSFSAWSSKLSRSLDRVTNGRSLDSPATYIDGVTRVFRLAQSIDNHLVAIAAEDFSYAELGQQETIRIQQGLRRASDFFGQVICQFILRDLGIFLDKYVKRGGAWVGGE